MFPTPFLILCNSQYEQDFTDVISANPGSKMVFNLRSIRIQGENRFKKIYFDMRNEYLIPQAIADLFYVLQPEGQLEVVRVERETDFNLKIAGFINVIRVKDVILAHKPKYAVGSSVKINLKKPIEKPLEENNLAALEAKDELNNELYESSVNLDKLRRVKLRRGYDSDDSDSEVEDGNNKQDVDTKLDDKKGDDKKTDDKKDDGKKDDDDELINPDELLDEDDYMKPNPISLKACRSIMRTPCRDCSCGLVEDLITRSKDYKDLSPPKLVPKSSCGSCYLGDAFRCASCPWLGMPAFEPGQRVELSGSQLLNDI